MTQWPDTCERCGKPSRADWCDTSTYGDPGPVLVKGLEQCSDPKCGWVCRICRRDIGDVHAAECAPLVLDKLRDGAYVTREDCR